MALFFPYRYIFIFLEVLYYYPSMEKIYLKYQSTSPVSRQFKWKGLWHFVSQPIPLGGIDY